MPRLPNALLRKAYAANPFLPPLLGPCRDLVSAQNELRWLREHVDKISRSRRAKGAVLAKGELLKSLVKKRAKGWPLQYALGSEFFGDLEVECRPRVLIPRPETAASVTHLARLMTAAQDLPSELRILDLCTGTGCIPLLFHHEFSSARPDIELRLLGFDISRTAIALANRNLERMSRNNKHLAKGTIEFMIADVLVDRFTEQTYKTYAPNDALPLISTLNFSKKPMFWDILISNPPYISPDAFRTTTARSVRGFEPRLALVPPYSHDKTDAEQGDTFYPKLLLTAREIETKIVLLEVANLDQALRVACMAREMKYFDGVEIWRDQPDQPHESNSQVSQDFSIIGQGNGRSVLCWRNQGATWLGKGT